MSLFRESESSVNRWRTAHPIWHRRPPYRIGFLYGIGLFGIIWVAEKFYWKNDSHGHGHGGHAGHGHVNDHGHSKQDGHGIHGSDHAEEH